MTPDDRGFNSLFENRNRSGVGVDYSLFLDSDAHKRGRSSVPASFEHAPPGFSSDFLSEGEPSSVRRPFDGVNSRFEGSFDRASIGETLTRSHSAAPSFDGRISLGPPPGLANSETPLVSHMTSGGESYLAESVVDRRRVVQMGQRRPASTGVIGQSQYSPSAVLNSLGLGGGGGGSAVRPAAKTLMDLIQEDFPPDSASPGEMYDSYPPRDHIYSERPRTTSPLSQHTRDHYYADRDNVPFGPDGRNGLTASMDRLQIRPEDAYGSPVSASLIFFGSV
jgi:hypothetical protein